MPDKPPAGIKVSKEVVLVCANPRCQRPIQNKLFDGYCEDCYVEGNRGFFAKNKTPNTKGKK